MDARNLNRRKGLERGRPTTSTLLKKTKRTPDVVDVVDAPYSGGRLRASKGGRTPDVPRTLAPHGEEVRFSLSPHPRPGCPYYPYSAREAKMADAPTKSQQNLVKAYFHRIRGLAADMYGWLEQLAVFDDECTIDGVKPFAARAVVFGAIAAALRAQHEFLSALEEDRAELFEAARATGKDRLLAEAMHEVTSVQRRALDRLESLSAELPWLLLRLLPFEELRLPPQEGEA